MYIYVYEDIDSSTIVINIRKVETNDFDHYHRVKTYQSGHSETQTLITIMNDYLKTVKIIQIDTIDEGWKIHKCSFDIVCTLISFQIYLFAVGGYEIYDNEIDKLQKQITEIETQFTKISRTIHL